VPRGNVGRQFTPDPGAVDRRQTITDLEVIVVDDSTDETSEILQSLAERRSDPRLKIFRGSAVIKEGSSGGLAAARNTGIKAGLYSQVFYDIDFFRKKASSVFDVGSITPGAYGRQTALVLRRR
jgi:hypothetical protein